MKRLLTAWVAAAVIGAAPGLGIAGSKAENGAAASQTAVGVIKKIEPAAGRITLRHEPIAALGWPAMTMPFAVKDRRILESLKPDQKVEFTFVQNGGAPVITAIR